CEGDSGGPALDADGKVVGVVSRSGDACEEPVYGTVTAWRDLIIRVAKRAATLGGYEPPSWVQTGSSEGPNVEPPCEGCAGNGPENGFGGRGTLPSGQGGSTGTGSSARPSGGSVASGGRPSMTGVPATLPASGASDSEPTPDEELEASCNMGHAPPTATSKMGVLLGVVGVGALRRRRRVEKRR
ncbi:MAG TPA: trypsin-like serine protease, partial [Polyangiaceae bacterium]|nr:trypsin-like serine protease [Polyangiaceae bacterium]